jgi:hypothetical protein
LTYCRKIKKPHVGIFLRAAPAHLAFVEIN